MKHNQFRQVVFPIITAMIWGSSFVAQSTSTEHVGAYTFNAARSFVGFLALLVVVQIFKMLRKEPPAEQTAAEKKATYEEIKAYVLEHTGLKVSSLYIAQIKQKHGIIERENYNKPKSEDARQPQCPPEKEKAITEALRHFGMI